MPTVTRDIRIDATPEVVRRHLVEPEKRRSWLGEEVEARPTDEGVRYHRGAGDDRSEVHIAVVPDGTGSRVVVTERTLAGERPDGGGVPADAPVASVSTLYGRSTPLARAA